MRTLVGELPVESGSVRLAPADATIGWLPQVTPDPDESLLDYARRRTGVAEADRALHAASEALAAQRPDADHEYAEALERWLHLGAADLEDRLPQVAAQVGLDVGAGPPARHPVRRADRAGRAGRRAAEPVRRAAARRARPTTWTHAGWS